MTVIAPEEEAVLTLPPVIKVTPAERELLIKARSAIQEKWGKNVCLNMDGARCLLGAIDYAFNPALVPGNPYSIKHRNKRTFKTLINKVSRMIGGQSGLFTTSIITRYNDTHRKKDVLRILDELID